MTLSRKERGSRGLNAKQRGREDRQIQGGRELEGARFHGRLPTERAEAAPGFPSGGPTPVPPALRGQGCLVWRTHAWRCKGHAHKGVN